MATPAIKRPFHDSVKGVQNKNVPSRKTSPKSLRRKVKCWEVFDCKETSCPAYKSKSLRCWLFSGTHCRSEIQGEFIEKMELCTHCRVFKKNIDLNAMTKTLETIDSQFRSYKEIVRSRDRELEGMSMELALSLSEVFEALKKISSGDPTVRIPEESTIELINKLKYIVNLTAREIGEIVDQSHEFAIALAEHFDVLHKVSKGDLTTRVTGKSQVELLEYLKKITNEMIESISEEITKRKHAETELLKAYDNLEQRVRERTAELQVTNERLRHEISEREKAEKNLREAELRYRTIADFTHDWEYWEAPDKTLRYVSPAAERITGYKAHLFIENPRLVNEIIFPEDASIWGMHHHEALEETGSRDITFRIRRRDGSVCWIEHVCQPVIDSEGNFLGVRASNRDITKRKKAEEKLRNALSLLSTTLESTADGILAVDMKGEIVSFNQKFLNMWRIPKAFIEGRNFRYFLTNVRGQLKDPENFLHHMQELQGQNESERFEVLEFSDERIFEYYSHPQRIGQATIGRVWSFRDITERKKAERARRESEQLLLQAHKMEAIGRLAAGIAHEINNPLAIINEKAGLIKDFLEFSGDITQDKEKFLGLIQGIFESVNRCRTITHRLLGFSRRMDVSYNTIDLNDTLREVIEFVEKEILYKNIRLEMKLGEGIPQILSDKGQLEQVFLNILNNAVDAVDKGGTISIVTDRKDEDTVIVAIRDNGHGIPEQIMKHIFEPFYTTKEKGRGTGLGLSISYGIIQKLGGNILVESTVNKGTTLTLEIPVKPRTSEGVLFA